jgi:hypothetical protein
MQASTNKRRVRTGPMVCIQDRLKKNIVGRVDGLLLDGRIYLKEMKSISNSDRNLRFTVHRHVICVGYVDRYGHSSPVCFCFWKAGKGAKACPRKLSSREKSRRLEAPTSTRKRFPARNYVSVCAISVQCVSSGAELLNEGQKENGVADDEMRALQDKKKCHRVFSDIFHCLLLGLDSLDAVVFGIRASLLHTI